ncbi:hypothetical protein [Rhodohalobacter sp. 8-1]|uniref:hypothetical protein n=1 Tax=Rhodohalobacter sp. 8-1 TaxID=3131972 RepID=UPI0030EEC82D
MKTLLTKTIVTIFAFLFVTAGAYAQQDRDLQYFVAPDKTGLNQFEAPFTTDMEFDGLKVRIGGSNTLQFQGISHDNDAGSLPELENNFNLATSNLDFDVQLDRGLRMHLRTYLSSQHHPEAWVKGGYIQIDRLDFIAEDFAAGLMDNLRFKVGHMELNYGDAHFRRTDNGAAIHNPFVGNYIMDSFTTEVAGEIYYYSGPIFGMFGLSNGKLNQSTEAGAFKTHATVYGKLGYDKQINDDFRFRLTGSILNVSQSPSIYLYSGDRAGTRYYNVITPGNFRAGRYAPSFTPGRGQDPGVGEMTSIMINPFVKFNGLEFFGLIESVTGKQTGSVDTGFTEPDSRNFTQLAGEVLYRFGASEDIYLGARYNLVDGEQSNGDIEITRFNIGGGWFLTNNVLAKLEYVTQSYDGEGFDGGPFDGATFDGVMLEAVVSF